MSGTNYIASNWRVPENSNSSKNDNYSLDFSTTSSTINCGNITALNGKTNASWSFWLNCGTTGINGIMNQWGGSTDRLIYAFIWLANGRIDVYISGFRSFYVNSNAIINALSTGQWFNLVITYDGTQAITSDRVKVYIDNQEVTGNLDFAPASLNNSTTDFVIGTYPSGTYWNGQMSDVALFDYTLDLPQISTLYGNTTSGAGNPMSLKPTPIAYYPLGDNSSGGIDVGPTSILTQPNVSVDDSSVFDFGTSDYIEVPQINTTGAISISAWIKTTDTNYNMIYNEDEALRSPSGSNRNLFFSTVNTVLRFNLRFDAGGSTTVNTSGVTLNDGNWHHVVGVWNGTTDSNEVKLFVDGVLRGQGTAAETIRKNFTMLGNIGGSSTTYDMNGELSNVQTYTTGLSYGSASSLGDTAGGEIAELYNSGVPLTGTQPQEANLKAWWKLDQSANWEADTSGNWQIPDAVSAYPQSFSFNGTNQYIPIGTTSLGITSAITVSAWVKIPTTNTGGPSPYIQEFICEDNTGGSNRNWALNWRHQSVSNKYFGFSVWHTDGSVTSITSTGIVPNDGNWHHIMGTFDGTTDANGLKLYVDGTLFQTTAGSTGIRSTSGVAPSIGAIENGSGFRFEGNLSNIVVWDSVQNIDDIYNSGTPATSYGETPTAWWKLDNTATFSTNWSVPDASGNGNDGTSSGMTEQSLVNNNVSTLNGESSGMTSGNLVLSDLTRNLPYENYSMNFAGTEYVETASTFSLLDGQTSASFSMWIKPNAVNIFQYLFSIVRSAISTEFQVACYLDNVGRIRVFGDTTSLYTYSNTGVVSAGVWTHLCITFDLSQPLANRVIIYINGVDETDPSFKNMNITQFATSTSGLSIAKNQNNHLPEFEGLLSQFSVFNSTLTSTEVLKLYANGLPQDLTNFTPQPSNWWTLGKESFWNGSDWIVRDMIGSNDGISANMAVSDLIGDAPRSEANGTGTNMDIPTNLVGNAGFSDKNAYSINMGPSARVTDTP